MMNTEEFILKAIKKHGDKYDYSKVVYQNTLTDVCIICPTHGEFWQKPIVHLRGGGCQKCACEKIHSIQRKTQEDFIKQCIEKHGNEYDYSKAKYVNIKTKVTVTCQIHGDFQVSPLKHIYRGDGCPKCRYIKSAKSNKFTTEEFIEKARKVHGNKYDYSKTVYLNYDEEVCIICPVHGEFWQTPDSHLQGSGCQSCSNTISKNEKEIYDFICSKIGVDNVVRRDRTILNKKELDILIPSLSIAFEYNGLRWHSENFKKDTMYHLNKTSECLSKGIKLYHIFEDEYVKTKNIVLSKIEHLLHLQNSKKHIMARKCSVSEIEMDDAKRFLTDNHIQGFHNSSIYLGAKYNGNLVGVMTFIKTKNCYELNRFATDINVVCQGIGGKIFKYFVENYEFDEIKSFADKRWSFDDGNCIYYKLGFVKECDIKPSYWYYDSAKPFERIHKFNCRKNVLNKRYGFPLTMTENEMVEKLGYAKIWDCGLTKYVYKK